MRIPAVLPLSLLVLGGCSAAEVKPAAPSLVDVRTAGWDCSGNLVPPNGYRPKTHFVDAGTPNAEAVALREGRAEFLADLCRGAEGSCDSLRDKVAEWKTGRGDGRVCVMLVVENAEYEAWKRTASSLRLLDEGLRRAAAAIVSTPGLRVAVDRVVDEGVAGGLRAAWLADRMAEALQQAGATLVMLPRSWSGLGLPDGVELVVRGQTIARREDAVPVLEATWKGIAKDHSLRVAPPFVFPAEAAPKGPAQTGTALPEGDGRLALRVEAAKAGSLCEGDRTQVRLTSAETLHVRVFDLFGDGGLMLFPNDERPNGLVRAGETIPLGGPDGFDVVMWPGVSAERFLVVGAASEAQLGAWAKVRSTCRLKPDQVRALVDGASLPAGVRVGSDGFRLKPADECPAFEPARRAELVEAVRSLSACEI